MPFFDYRAYDASGRSLKGRIDAESARAAKGKLKAQGLYLTDLAEETTAREEGGSGQGFLAGLRGSRLFQRLGQAELSAAVRQFATLISAGLPLVGALNALMEQVDNPVLKRVLADVKGRVTEGVSLADALGRHPKVFPDLFCSMVAAGEASGALEVVLQRLADFMEDRVRLVNKVRATLAYPAFMVVIGSGVLFFMLTFVVPMITTVFEDTGQILPLPTRLLMAISAGLSRWWWLLLLAAVGAGLWLRRAVNQDSGRRVYDRLKLRLPLLGDLNRKLIVVRFARTLGTLLQSGIPLLKALDISKTVAGNMIFAAAIEAARATVGEGEDLATPLKRSGVFPPLVIHMVAAGEHSGQLEGMLFKVADSYENDVETTVTSLTSLLEPVMILVMAVVVGFMVLAILLPIFDMSSTVR
ncbi:MAG: type II secretion system inner membrane protein GspF [Pseudomonadota bacterium]